jgi:hypothetical protein
MASFSQKEFMECSIYESIVTCQHGNAWVTVVGLIEAVIARQQGKYSFVGNNMQQKGKRCFLFCPPQSYVRGVSEIVLVRPLWKQGRIPPP